MKTFRVKDLFTFLLVCIVLWGSIIIGVPANANVFKNLDKEKIAKKIKELKTKEKVEIKKLTVTQQNLEKTRDSIKTYEDKLVRSKTNVSKLQYQLNTLSGKHERLANSAAHRIREVYKGERIGLIHLIFASRDISTFLDRLYYQKIMLKKDKELMADLKRQSDEIMRSKRYMEHEKRNIAYTLTSMNQKKKSLHNSIQTSEYMIEKLRTDRVAYEQAQKELESLSRDIEKNIARTISTEITDSAFIRPVVGAITSAFGWRRHPIFRSTRFHSGVDIAGPNRTPIKASNSGKVIHSGWYGGYGKVVIINHGTIKEGSYAGKKVSTLYAHMSSIAVGAGSSVRKGDIVGYEGSTGYSTGPHLHFEVRIDGKPINPLSFIGR